MNKYNYSQDELERNKKALYASLDKLGEAHAEKVQPYIDAQPKMLEMKETDDRSDDEILSEVRKKIEQTYGQKVQKAQDDAASSSATLAQKIKELAESAQERKDAATKTYDKAINVVEGDAVKRGIARSSIANEGVAALERDRVSKINDIDDETRVKTEETQAKIDALSEELKKLIEELGIQKEEDEASEYEKAIKKRLEGNNKIIEYNNEAATKNASTLNKYNKSAAKAQLDALNYQYELDKVQKVVDFYKTFADKNAALDDLLSDESLKNYLGDKYELALKMIKA